MDPDFLTDPDPDSGKKVLSGSRLKDPDPNHEHSVCREPNPRWAAVPLRYKGHAQIRISLGTRREDIRQKHADFDPTWRDSVTRKVVNLGLGDVVYELDPNHWPHLVFWFGHTVLESQNLPKIFSMFTRLLENHNTNKYITVETLINPRMLV